MVHALWPIRNTLDMDNLKSNKVVVTFWFTPKRECGPSPPTTTHYGYGGSSFSPPWRHGLPPYAPGQVLPGHAAFCSTGCQSRLPSVPPRQLQRFTGAPDVGDGPQGSGNHQILGSVDLGNTPFSRISNRRWRGGNLGIERIRSGSASVKELDPPSGNLSVCTTELGPLGISVQG
jgi:hypothetical protein